MRGQAKLGRWAARAVLPLALVVGGLPGGGARESAAAGDDVPLPLTGRQTVKANGKRYVIDGPQVVPAGALIKLEPNVHVVGVNGASLDVRGGFRTIGISGSPVKIENVDFSPTSAPENEVHFDSTDLTGCSFAQPPTATFSGGFTMENAKFYGGTFAMRVQSGYVKLMSVGFNVDCSIECVPDKGQPPEVSIRGANLQGLTLKGSAMATVRLSTLKGPLQGTGFTSLVVDACDLSGDLIFAQGTEGSFSKLQLTKGNLLGGSRIVFQRPVGPKTAMEKVRIDKFYFGTSDGKADLTDKQIGDRIQDGADDPEVSVKAYWQNPQERPR